MQGGKEDPGYGKEEEMGRGDEDEDIYPGGGKESSFIIELKLYTILGGIS